MGREGKTAVHGPPGSTIRRCSYFPASFTKITYTGKWSL